MDVETQEKNCSKNFFYKLIDNFKEQKQKKFKFLENEVIGFDEPSEQTTNKSKKRKLFDNTAKKTNGSKEMLKKNRKI